VSEDARRLFVAVRVSSATTNGLAGAVETLARRAAAAKIAVRWMPPTLYHVTLKFLGWTRDEALPALRDRLAAAVADVEPFAFSTARLGAFASLERATVLWAGATARDNALAALAGAVDTATADLGFAAAPPFVGHVTLGRLSEPTAMNEVLLPLMEQMFSDTKVAGVSLLESTLKSGSLTYRERAYFELSAAKNGRKRQSPPLQLGPQGAPSASDSPSHDIDTDDGWPRGHSP
jgi:RNA 2',3'-cyclic 3'-phosphodiesterase